MKQNIYTALKQRISVIPFTEETKDYYKAQGWEIPTGATHYLLHIEDLGEDFFDIAHPMYTTNLWNVAQRFWSFVKSAELETALLSK